MNACRICGEVDHRKKVTKQFGIYESTWVECVKCKVQRIYPYPTQEELTSYYNDQYLLKECSGSVSHRQRFSPECRPIVFNEYSLSLSLM